MSYFCCRVGLLCYPRRMSSTCPGGAFGGLVEYCFRPVSIRQCYGCIRLVELVLFLVASCVVI